MGILCAHVVNLAIVNLVIPLFRYSVIPLFPVAIPFKSGFTEFLRSNIWEYIFQKIWQLLHESIF